MKSHQHWKAAFGRATAMAEEANAMNIQLEDRLRVSQRLYE